MSILTHDEAKRLSQSSTDPLEVIRNVEAAVIVKLAVSQNALKDEIRLIWKPKCDALRQQLEAAQAEVKHLNLHLKATQSGRDAALARLSEIERQEPVAEMTLVDMGIGDARQLRVNWLMDGYLDVGAKLYASAGASPAVVTATKPLTYLQRHLQGFTCTKVEDAGGTEKLTLYMTKLGAHSEYQLYDNEALALWVNLGKALGPEYTGAGASPVEPNFCESCAMDLSTCDCVTPRPVFVNQLPSVQPSESAEHWHSLYIKKCQELHDEKARLGAEIETLELAAIDESGDPSDAAFVKACRDELAKRKPEPAAETVGGLAKAVKAARGGDAPPAPMRRFA